MRFDLRASHVKRTALSDQTQFGRFLRGAELKLAASLHSVKGCGGRPVLVQHLDRLSPTTCCSTTDPSRLLVSLLKLQRISFCMRAEKGRRRRLACERDFLRSGLLARVVTLRAPGRRAADDYECPREPQQVRWREVDRINHAYPHIALKPFMPALLRGQRSTSTYVGC